MRLVDDKWDTIFGEVVPQTRQAVAGVLGLPDPDSLVFAANTHQFVVQLLSSLDGFGTRPVAHPHDRRRVPLGAPPVHAIRRRRTGDRRAGSPCSRSRPSPPGSASGSPEGGDDFVYLSHVHFDSGYVTPGLAEVVAACPPSVPVMIDGYHSFMAIPTDLGPIADRAFYTSGGYKYAMAGEGCCFLHAPPGWIERPVVTGWFAGFAAQGRRSR